MVLIANSRKTRFVPGRMLTQIALSPQASIRVLRQGSHYSNHSQLQGSMAPMVACSYYCLL